MTLDIIENAAMALCNSHLPKGWHLASDEERTLYRELAGSVIVFVTPLIEAATLERAALAIEARLLLMDDLLRDIPTTRDGAAAIRALKERP